MDQILVRQKSRIFYTCVTTYRFVVGHLKGLVFILEKETTVLLLLEIILFSLFRYFQKLFPNPSAQFEIMMIFRMKFRETIKRAFSKKCVGTFPR